MRDPPVDDETSGGEEPEDAEDGCVSSRYDMQEMLAALTDAGRAGLQEGVENVPLPEAGQAGPPRPQASQAGYSDMASKLVDLRGITRPPVSDGEDTCWNEWRFRFQSLCGLLDLTTVMKAAARYGRPVPRAALLREAEARGPFLYGLLVGVYAVAERWALLGWCPRGMA